MTLNDFNKKGSINAAFYIAEREGFEPPPRRVGVTLNNFNKKGSINAAFYIAEREGFEPPEV